MNKKLEDNIKIICEKLAEDIVNNLEAENFDKDKAMILNNLAEYIMPKLTRSNTKDVHLAPEDLPY